MEVFAVAMEIEYRVNDELTRAMVSDFAASFGANEKGGCGGVVLMARGGEGGGGEENMMEGGCCA